MEIRVLIHTWIDDHGFLWIFNQPEGRVYCHEAELEEPEGNGYPAQSEAEAYQVLVDGGYIDVQD